MPPQVAASNEPIERVACDAVVVGAFQDGGVTLAPGAEPLDAALDGALSEYLVDAEFKAGVGSISTVPTLGRIPAKAVVVVGLGSRENVGTSQIRHAAGAAGRALVQRAQVACTLHAAVGNADAAAAEVEGLLLGAYQFRGYKSQPRPVRLQHILSIGGAGEALERGATIARAVNLARDLSNEPASTLGPDALARRAAEVAEVENLECRVLDENELAAAGFGGILGVAQGSERPPRLIQLRYAPETASGKVALVGKGITFDSGGLSIKDAKSMEFMKSDMSGAASVIAAMSVLARLKASVEVLGYIPATDNMISGKAIRPGDVITHYGGTTSEVLNTDAEGRLVLGDALALASEQQPDAIVDVATLTGAIGVALGNKAAGLFSNDDELAAEIETAAANAGERVWRMPIFDDYRPDMDSDVADIKNIAGRFGGAIYATLFLRDFVVQGIPWAHLDIAGSARADKPYNEISKGGTGYATRTLISWIEGRRH